MLNIRLETANGQFVHASEIPPFLPGHEPDFILWGNRFFQRFGEDTYRECSFYALLD